MNAHNAPPTGTSRRGDRTDDAAARDNEPEADDSKMYTGEPVDTPEGTERPQQMNVGADNMQGGGEWPDPETPPAQ